MPPDAIETMDGADYMGLERVGTAVGAVSSAQVQVEGVLDMVGGVDVRGR
jgi:hypothetical protein